MAYDIDMAVRTRKLIAYDEFASDPSDAYEVQSWLVNERSFFDVEREIIYIPDIGDGHLYGVMTAELDLDVVDEDEPLDMWALENIPAPGTNAPDRMGLMEVEEASEWIADNNDRFMILSEIV